MISLKSEDLKSATSRLFVKDTFDRWLLREAVIVTFNVFTIDGHIRQGYYSDEELEEKQIEALSTWKMIRPFCFELIKGKKLPESFRITLQLAPSGVRSFLAGAGLNYDDEQIGGLYLNFRYEKETLHMITGTSVKIFLPDRRLEQEWDEYVRQYLRGSAMPFTDE
ncbi:MAG: DUF5721 family protein [Clostridiales bacterium]|nr:DUF5721 family protein [Clostridiales bacterium]